MGNDPWEEYKKKHGVTIFDAFDPNVARADEKVAEERLSICASCPELIKLTKQCKKCGCFMSIKARLEEAKCPLGKW